MAIYRDERFLFDDPASINVINRTTRYRMKKRRRLHTAEGSEVEESRESLQTETVFENFETGASNVDFADPSDDAICEDEDNLPNTLTGEDHESDNHQFEANGPDDVYYLSTSADDSSVLMQYPEVEPDLEEEVVELSDGELENDTQMVGAPEMLYDGSQLTSESSSVLVMKFKSKHKLSNEGLQDLLHLIKLHCPTPNKCVTSSYRFNKQFGENSSVQHFFCNSCFHSVDATSVICPNVLCSSPLADSRSSFTEVPVLPQLKRLLERQGVYDTIRGRLRNNTCNDVCGGALYMELISNHSHTLRSFVTLTFNTDGIPVFKSSKYAFWPMFLVVNELPYKMRIRKENMLFVGLWHGSIKPDMSLFLKPLAESLQRLSTEGVNVTPYQSTEVNCKAILLCFTCDLPAKAAVLNCVQFNGFYGCSRCMQQGKSVKCASGGTVRVYPYDERSPTGPKRTHMDTVDHGEKAIAENKSVFGVKGLSWLSAVPYFDTIRGTSVDYMHCVLLGVCRHLLKLWTNKGNHNSPWYVGKDVKQLDKRLLLIKPPSEVRRTPRSLESTLKFWKAHELRAWLLHYSPIVLHGILPSEYYQHHLLFVEGVYLLLKQVVSQGDVEQSSRLLNHYCFMFSFLYGERYVLPNVHGLLHLPEDVRDLGPLWSHSCFPFESGNGELLKLFHGSQSVDKQVIDGVKKFVELPERADLCLAPGSKEHDLFQSMCSNGRHSRSPKIFIEPTIAVIGHPLRMDLSCPEASAFSTAGVHVPDHVFVYRHLLLTEKDRLITCSSCSKATKRNNSCVRYRSAGGGSAEFGLLKKLLMFKDSDGYEGCYGIVQTLKPASFPICEDSVTSAKLNDHILAFYPPRDDDLVVIAAGIVIDKAIFLEVQTELNYVFVSLFPNHSEVE